MKRQLSEIDEYYIEQEELYDSWSAWEGYDECFNWDLGMPLSPNDGKIVNQVTTQISVHVEENRFDDFIEMFRVTEEYELNIDETYIVQECIDWDRVRFLDYMISRGNELNNEQIISSCNSPKVTKYLFSKGYDLTEAEQNVHPDDELMLELYKKFKLIESLKSINEQEDPDQVIE